MPLHMRIPKLKGFTNPFRVEYQAINLDTLDDSGLDEVSPESLLRQGPGRQGCPGQGPRPGRDHPRRHRQGPRLLGLGRSRHHRSGRYAWNACPSRGANGRPPAKGNQFTNR